ncbi:transforming protein RhoA-like protein [Radiomyces spectabilis]|uniref:transforming protein RhoA-like protein n=1 Tax=Radiomyces spectabilis TaxID=64574 RepID=UPI0022203DE6|nr:transforming protein RhoA-like protein [Radiomyces spectabilis]KAI8377626.1 transforming protein RhoA-like protein [Radiomyces spectabilis]
MRRPLRKKIVIVGDGACGKTSFLIVYQNGQFPEKYLPTVFENYMTRLELDGHKSVELALWDTAGQEDYDRLRPLSYYETDVVLICFAVDNPISLQNVRDKWLPEVKHYCGNVALVLVGLKVDLRKNTTSSASMVTPQQGAALAKEIKAKYCECSAKENLYVSDVIRTAAQVAVKPRHILRKRWCRIL